MTGNAGSAPALGCSITQPPSASEQSLHCLQADSRGRGPEAGGAAVVQPAASRLQAEQPGHCCNTMVCANEQALGLPGKRLSAAYWMRKLQLPTVRK
eukprot:CAMPEP_0179027830 /NCGR_PEP_ID=MMETSP0796-20121207/9236_1 /TAXON_ID=73915 /ORGANISM="Pyrodinium bahamense, Strain pbaha01" /LENGTH=96 /DNA_ID=CAMNT_0020723961 /DNA_START=503 /DNA_END=791 /DNA_ORIENTATION=+